MSRVARLLIYEGTEDQLQEQLGRSMNEGTRQGSPGVTITCITLPPILFRFCEVVGQEVIEAAYLQGDHKPKPFGEA
jgi:hypothetical protein